MTNMFQHFVMPSVWYYATLIHLHNALARNRAQLLDDLWLRPHLPSVKLNHHTSPIGAHRKPKISLSRRNLDRFRQSISHELFTRSEVHVRVRRLPVTRWILEVACSAPVLENGRRNRLVVRHIARSLQNVAL